MKRKTFRMLVSIFTLVVAMSACTAVAFAADSTTPTGDAQVMIDGKYVTFAGDSLPQNVDGRIMVPYRSIFEYLGAEVSYDENTKIISGSNDEMSLSMKNGDKNINITYKGGETKVKTMDVAPFISDAGRTYVPTRFVSEVLGYSVGWDNDKKTVIVIDADSITGNVSDDFSTLMKVQELNADMNQTYEVTGDINASVKVNVPADTEAGTAATTSAIDVTGKIDGVVKGVNENLNMDMNMKADGETTNMKMNMILNGETGDMYMKGDQVTEKNQWMKMNIYDLTKDSGIDLKSLMDLSASGKVDMNQLISSLISASSDSYDVDTYKDINTAYAALKAALGNDAFKKSGNAYTAEFNLNTLGLADALGEGATCSGKIVINTDSSDKATGYQMVVDMKVPSEDLSMSIDLKGTALTADINMSFKMAELADMTMGMTMDMKTSDKTVNTTIPAGDTVLDIAALLGSLIPTNQAA